MGEKYIAIYVWGGIIQDVFVGEDLAYLKRQMIENGDQGFEPETDDLKIYNTKNECIFSYETHEERGENNESI